MACLKTNYNYEKISTTIWQKDAMQSASYGNQFALKATAHDDIAAV
jgi:hypothetical protein